MSSGQINTTDSALQPPDAVSIKLPAPLRYILHLHIRNTSDALSGTAARSAVLMEHEKLYSTHSVECPTPTVKQ